MSISFSQEVTSYSQLEDSVLYKNSNCLRFSFFIPGSDYVIYFSPQASDKIYDKGVNAHINESEAKILLSLLSRHIDVNAIFLLGDEGYESTITNQILFSEDARLLIQLDYGGDCHYDTQFLIVKNVNDAKIVLKQLKNLDIHQKTLDKMVGKLNEK